ncbi:hypothetical protein JDV02_000293 [Purpureocillium takamizusanense]|uniref:Zn(2)-C6 fungal-type domain-containing protein n=1 Tax=Purpureocillium takamizusanense TaxID=2060973 RepID=A0A9Q8V690_9HYPO|nr:uncharacterized protein JDV02_000293 [Purpureocillium takamizusanense]UNI13562.1 hypothetical protein JDV02_000293 [Purpureocillium takamizusanense]
MGDNLTIFVSTARRSRWGCQACRNRRKKCDEERPSCQACIDRRVPCVYSVPKSQRRSTSAYVPLRQACSRRPVIDDDPGAAAIINATNHPSVILPATPTPTTKTLNASGGSGSSSSGFVAHFHSIVAGLISFAPCGAQNPFFAHVLPLASVSTLVRTAVEAVAAAHLHGLGVAPRLRAQSLQLDTLRQLAAGCVRRGGGEIGADAREQLVTASLLLIYYEVVLGSSVRAARCHLRGAKAILDTDPSLLGHSQGHGGVQQQQHQQPSARMRFLCKVFLYFDVMIALSLREAPLGLRLASPIDAGGVVDETFGLTGSLWPMMQRLAELLARRHQGECVSREAEVLEHELQSWSIESAAPNEPPSSSSSPSSLSTTTTAAAAASSSSSPVSLASPPPLPHPTPTGVDAEAMVQIAQTYKYSSLLTLYSSTLLDGGCAIASGAAQSSSPPPSLVQQETYRRALDSLLRVCVLSGTMSTLTWPLYTVALQARSASDRTLVEQMFARLQQRQHMRVVDDARRSAAKHWGRAGQLVVDDDTTVAAALQEAGGDAAILLG